MAEIPDPTLEFDELDADQRLAIASEMLDSFWLERYRRNPPSFYAVTLLEEEWNNYRRCRRPAPEMF